MANNNTARAIGALLGAVLTVAVASQGTGVHINVGETKSSRIRGYRQQIVAARDQIPMYGDYCTLNECRRLLAQADSCLRDFEYSSYNEQQNESATQLAIRALQNYLGMAFGQHQSQMVIDVDVNLETNGTKMQKVTAFRSRLQQYEQQVMARNAPSHVRNEVARLIRNARNDIDTMVQMSESRFWENSAREAVDRVGEYLMREL